MRLSPMCRRTVDAWQFTMSPCSAYVHPRPAVGGVGKRRCSPREPDRNGDRLCIPGLTCRDLARFGHRTQGNSADASSSANRSAFFRGPSRRLVAISQRGTLRDRSMRAMTVGRRDFHPTHPRGRDGFDCESVRTADRQQLGAGRSETSQSSASWRRRRMAPMTTAEAARYMPAVRGAG